MEKEEMDLLSKLLKYQERYMITIQFFPNITVVWIEKDSVELADFGGDAKFAFTKSLEYLNRINKKQNG